MSGKRSEGGEWGLERGGFIRVYRVSSALEFQDGTYVHNGLGYYFLFMCTVDACVTAALIIIIQTHTHLMASQKLF